MTTLNTAIKSNTVVTFEYRSQADATATTRRVAPFALVRDTSNAEYVLGYDVEKNGYRTYLAKDIANLAVTTETYDASALNTDVGTRWAEVLVRA